MGLKQHLTPLSSHLVLGLQVKGQDKEVERLNKLVSVTYFFVGGQEIKIHLS